MTFSFRTVIAWRQISGLESQRLLADSANCVLAESDMSAHFFSFAVFHLNCLYRSRMTRRTKYSFCGGMQSAPIVRNRLDPPFRYGAAKFHPKSPLSSRNTVKGIGFAKKKTRTPFTESPL